ncbi:TPA: hypothetical protein ACQT0W_001106 [Pseudomonas aeruginosa]
MIKNDSQAPSCTCPSGDGSLVHPCPAHPAVDQADVAAKLTFINGRPAMCGCQVEYSDGGGEYSDVIYVTLCAKHSGSAILDLVATNRIALTPEYEGQWHADLYLDREIPLAKVEGATPAEAVLALMSAERIDPEQESVEQASGDERAAFEAWATHLPMDRQPLRPDLYMPQTQWAWEAWQFRAALAQPSQSQYEASFEEWLANELEGEDGQPVPAAVCDIALARRAFNHWPKLEQPAKVGGVRFSAGVSSRLVVEAAQRLYEFESTPEKEAERIERLQAFREQLDPLNLAPHAEAFNEAPAEVLKPEQAERPEVVGVRYEDGTILSAEDCGIALEVCARVQTPLMTISQHERIVEARWNRAMDLLLDHVSRISEKFKAERDAALARVAELERQEPVAWMHDQPNRVDVIHRDVKDLLQRVPGSSRGIHRPLDVSEHYTIPLYAAPVAQAQHSVPEGWKLVPVEPTPEMLDARRDCEDGMDGYLVEDTEYYFPDRGAVRAFLARVYQGLIAAAPAPGGER